MEAKAGTGLEVGDKEIAFEMVTIGAELVVEAEVDEAEVDEEIGLAVVERVNGAGGKGAR